MNKGLKGFYQKEEEGENTKYIRMYNPCWEETRKHF